MPRMNLSLASEHLAPHIEGVTGHEAEHKPPQGQDATTAKIVSADDPQPSATGP